jgi:uncharacterized protein YprB with RNaseH-like and TPR domain
MSILTKPDIKTFLLEKKGYLKKSPLEVAKAIWKISSKHTLPKNKTELSKELENIRQTQAAMRLATNVVHAEEDEAIVNTYQKIIDEKNRPKRRLFFDIEVSPNMVFSWRIGNKVSIGHNAIIKERAIICVCWKWEDEDEVHSLEWNKGCDKALVTKFAKIIDSADEVITQNGDAFDIKWLRARCIFHDVPLSPKFNSHDTKKWAKSGFYFNCAKLDYMGQYLGEGQKIETDYDLWTDIVLKNDKKAMDKMVEYCKEDVALLQRIYNKLKPYVPEKRFKYKIK